MKLVAKQGRENSDRLVRADWQIGDAGYAWLSVRWEPTEEDYIYKSGKRNGYRGGENGFPQLASSFITDGSVVYAALSSIFGERPDMIQNLQERGFPCAIPLWSWRRVRSEPMRIEKISWLRRRFNQQRSDGVVYAEVDKDFAASSFERYGSWTSSIWAFLVCQRPLVNWAEQLHRVGRKGRVTKELMAQIDLFISNRWEHGFEFLSHSFSHEQLMEMAKDACSKLNWQLETRTS